MKEGKGRGGVERVRLLLDARKGDPLYGDRYAARAAECLRPQLSEETWEALRDSESSVAEARRQSQLALLHGEWARVKELAAQIGSLQKSALARREEMELGQQLYGSPEVPIDPFSPGFGPLFGASVEALARRRDDLVGTLDKLAASDPDWAPLYSGRRAYFAALPLTFEVGASAGPARVDPELVRQEALAALHQGDTDSVVRMAERMLARSKETPAARAADAPATPVVTEARVGAALPPFPDPVVERARALGLAHERRDPDLEVVHYLRAIAWIPSFPGEETPAGPGRRVTVPPPPSLTSPPEPVAMLLDQFALHPFVNSLGVRYLPALEPEWVLVEDFPEDAIPDASPLLAALGFDRRRALSRVAIERALRGRAAGVLEKLGLDAGQHLLVCVPADVYVNVGARRGWGRQEYWTHFDGYQVLRDGKLRALVGGDVRFGGIYDVCSIARDDEREGVVARFAVVRRERMQSRR
jgi:hypothetical protein